MLQIYEIRPGDSLWAIAQRFGVPLQRIIDLNDPPYLDRLTPGQTLLIPTEDEPQPPTFEYTVQPGDTLWAISRRFGVTIEDILSLNDIPDASRIFPGQVLIIPGAAPPPEPTTYVVQPGDTLWSISQRFGVSLSDLIELNDLADPSLIYPGQTLLIPPRDTPAPTPPPVPGGDGYPAIVNGYITAQGAPDRERVNQIGYALSYLSIFSYTFQPDGTLNTINDRPAIEAALAQGIGPLLTLTNIVGAGFNSQRAHEILNNPEAQQNLIEQLVTEMLTRGYVGINIDFEYVFPEDREPFNQFMRNLRAALEPEGLLLTSALAPKVSADQVGLLYEAHDYPAHGEIADYVVLMTYEWGWQGGPPMAIAPLNQVRRVLDYAVTEIPPEKIWMGVPVYARDWAIPWVQGTRARTFSVQEAVRQTIDQGVPIQYDEVAQSPFYRYTIDGQEREVWLEDARSIEAKLETAEEYQLAGISLWNVYGMFPQLWPLLADRLQIQKPALP